MKLSPFVVKACALVALAVPSAASAYERTEIPHEPGSCLYWEPRTIAWSPGTPLGGPLSSDAALDAIAASFGEWQRHGCSDLAFRMGAPARREVGFSPKGGNTNVVLFRERSCDGIVPRGHGCLDDGTCGQAFDCWYHGTETIALTTTTFSPCTGEIFDADIELNAAHFDFTDVDRPGVDDTDVRNTLVHEVGHLIGLAHSSDREATMYRSAPGGETKKRDLASDDVEALCMMYPAGGETVTCGAVRPEEQCLGGGAREDPGCSATGGEAAGAGFVALALWAWSRGRGGRGAGPSVVLASSAPSRRGSRTGLGS